MREADDTEEVIRAQRDLVQLYREFIAEVRGLRIELEAEMARLRAITNAIEAERDHSVPLQ
jgi:N-glycosylase/DNA lyase